MKITTGLLAGVAVLAMAMAAQAAPKVSGKYAYHSISMCQAQLTTATDGDGDVTVVNPANGGLISAEVGYITFPNSPASSGQASVSGRGFEGDAVRVNGAVNVRSITNGINGAFVLTETTFKLKTMLYQMRYGDVIAGNVARTVHFVRQEDPRCINIITATKQK